MKTRLLLILLVPFFSGLTSVNAQLQVGDPGVTFDTLLFDTDYPQIERWSETGVRGGIPFMDELNIVRTLNASDSKDINAAIEEVSSNGGGTILLSDGEYDITGSVYMKSNVILLGESRDGVKCIIDMTSGSAFLFEDISNSGIYRLTIEGSWGAPLYDWNIGIAENDELPDNSNVSVRFRETAIDCWLDQVDIINSAEHPLIVKGNHNTIRACKIDGVHKKSVGYQGYFHVAGSDNLVVHNYVTHLRHISIQDNNAEYNVVYKNTFDQEFSFHNYDGGNNLIEGNKITLPSDMPGIEKPNYYAIMGPWADKHSISIFPNYIYKNSCLELNNGHNNATPWSVTNIVYYGPHEVRPADPHTNFTEYSGGNPLGNTLYPVVLGKRYTETFEKMALSDWGTETYTGDSNIVWNIDAKGVSGEINANKGILFHSGNTGVVSGTIQGGISSFSVECKDIGDIDSQRKLELLINGEVVDSVLHTGPEYYNFVVNEIDISGDFTLAIRNASSTSLNNAIAIDNISWLSYTDVSGVSIVQDTISLYEGYSSYLTKIVLPVSASDKSVKWSSSDISIATVDSNGLVTGVVEGIAKIIAQTQDDNFYDSCIVLVLPPVLVTGVSIHPATLSLFVGQTELLTGTVSPEDATDKSVVWSSSNETVATVDASGMVSAQADGTAKIIVSTNDGAFSDTCYLTVNSLNGEAIYTETFEKMTLVGWGSETYTGDNDFVWNVRAKGTSGYIDSTKCIYMVSVEKNAESGIVSNPIPGGISSFTVQCKDLWSTGVERTLQLLINGIVVETIKHTGTEEYTFTVENINKPGDITIGINNVSQVVGEENNSIAIDNITWVTYSGAPNSIPEINDQTFSVKENSANGTLVGTVLASDPDADQTLSYSIIGGNSDNIFEINSASGELSIVDNTLLDYETATVHYLTVKVTDSDLFAESNTAVITINVEDVDDQTGINDNFSNTINIYPNPFTSSLLIQLGKKDYKQLKMVDITGREVISMDIYRTNEINLTPSYSIVPPGLYIIQLISDKELKTFRILRNYY
jgi:uncharacterized protein YjdB